MSEQQALCDVVLEHLADAVDGELSTELSAHVEQCDVCRDRIHDAHRAAEHVRNAGGGYVAPIDLEDRFLAALDTRDARKKVGGEPHTQPMLPAGGESSIGDDRAKDPVDERTAPAREARVVTVPQRVWRARRSVGAGLALAAAIAFGVIALHPKNQGAQTKTAAAPWKGMVTAVVVGGSGDGLFLVDDKGQAKPLRKGDAVAAGSHVRTDVRTRARIEMDDGSAMVLDRGADVMLDKSDDRAAKVLTGSCVFELSPKDGSQSKVSFPGGSVTSPGSKVALTAQDSTQKQTTSIAMARGVATVTDEAGHVTDVAAGEGGTISAGQTNIGATSGLASAFAWSELQETDLGEKADVPGLGEVRARLPGAKDDGDRALRLVKQSVKVRIAGELARTEIEETFASDDPQVLEGIFRFPLPPDAQIERLALDVDGKLEEGAFVDRDKGQKIWKGVTYNAQPHPIKPQPREEWIWVPGPWHDPALLEWNSGGRMELKIYPIPAKGSRRVVIAYTQRIAPSAGVRRYVYPLPHFAGDRVAVDDFSLDLAVMGQEPARPVSVRGYDVKTETNADGSVHGKLARTAFAPGGDVVIEYAKKGEGATATTYAYKAASGGASYVALSLAPALPRLPDGEARTQVIVVDSSRSMVGERWARASALAARVVEEMDPRDRFAVLACDVTCAPMAITTKTPSKPSADAVKKFLSTISPDGASDLVGAVQAASTFAKGQENKGRALRVVYVGDGTGSIGARTPSAIESGVAAALDQDATLTAVAIGVDADTKSLEALSRGGGGVMVPYVAGEKLGVAALSVLEATYGVSLRDAQLTLPGGLEQIAPSKLGALRAGDEALVVARMSGNEVTGDATLKGTVAGKPWSTTFPIAVRSSSDEGNAFVPRLFAATTIADLERGTEDEASKQKIVELSKTFAVPSRYTSLIVLESEAMSKAFGVEKQQQVALWTGDHAAVGTSTGAPDDLARASDAQSMDTLGSLGGPSTKGAMGGDGFGGGGLGDVGSTNGMGKAGGVAMPSSPKPAATTAPPTTVAAPPTMPNNEDKSGEKAKKVTISAPSKMPPSWGPGGGSWVRMRREWFRTVSFTADGLPPSDLETKITSAKSLTLATPDSRDKLADLFGQLARRDNLDEAEQVMGKWLGRDPLDPKALLLRSDLVAREGDRQAAMRIETGALDARPDNVELADALATVALRGGDAKLSCALRAVHADLKPKDVDAVARRVICARQTGYEATATRILGMIDPATKSAVEAKIPSLAAAPLPPVAGDLVVDATWSSGSPIDVDVSIVDPKGARFSWMTPSTAVSASDATSTTHEGLALPWVAGGSYAVEITRASGEGAQPVSGTVTVRMLGQARAFPFTLSGARVTAGRVNVSWSSRLVPDNGW